MLTASFKKSYFGILLSSGFVFFLNWVGETCGLGASNLVGGLGEAGES